MKKTSKRCKFCYISGKDRICGLVLNARDYILCDGIEGKKDCPLWKK